MSEQGLDPNKLWKRFHMAMALSVVIVVALAITLFLALRSASGPDKLLEDHWTPIAQTAVAATAAALPPGQEPPAATQREELEFGQALASVITTANVAHSKDKPMSNENVQQFYNISIPFDRQPDGSLPYHDYNVFHDNMAVTQVALANVTNEEYCSAATFASIQWHWDATEFNDADYVAYRYTQVRTAVEYIGIFERRFSQDGGPTTLKAVARLKDPLTTESCHLIDEQ